jgi:hypothetical protein
MVTNLKFGEECSEEEWERSSGSIAIEDEVDRRQNRKK